MLAIFLISWCRSQVGCSSVLSRFCLYAVVYIFHFDPPPPRGGDGKKIWVIGWLGKINYDLLRTNGKIRGKRWNKGNKKRKFPLYLLLRIAQYSASWMVLTGLTACCYVYHVLNDDRIFLVYFNHPPFLYCCLLYSGPVNNSSVDSDPAPYRKYYILFNSSAVIDFITSILLCTDWTCV